MIDKQQEAMPHNAPIPHDPILLSISICTCNELFPLFYPPIPSSELFMGGGFTSQTIFLELREHPEGLEMADQVEDSEIWGIRGSMGRWK